MKRAYFEIKENDRLADRTYEMKLTCPDNSHGVTRPGQFINIRLDGFFFKTAHIGLRLDGNGADHHI